MFLIHPLIQKVFYFLILVLISDFFNFCSIIYPNTLNFPLDDPTLLGVL